MVRSNERIAKRERERNIVAQFGGNGVWIVDANRIDLTADEKQKGFKGPIRALQTALDRIKVIQHKIPKIKNETRLRTI